MRKMERTTPKEYEMIQIPCHVGNFSLNNWQEKIITLTEALLFETQYS
jgi:hypothetical protein